MLLSWPPPSIHCCHWRPCWFYPPPLLLLMYLVVAPSSSWDTFSPSAQWCHTTSSGVFYPQGLYSSSVLCTSVCWGCQGNSFCLGLPGDQSFQSSCLHYSELRQHPQLEKGPHMVHSYVQEHPMYCDLLLTSAHVFGLQLECFCHQHHSCQFLCLLPYHQQDISPLDHFARIFSTIFKLFSASSFTSLLTPINLWVFTSIVSREMVLIITEFRVSGMVKEQRLHGRQKIVQNKNMDKD